MADVFISHSSKDKEIAEKVLNYFEERGLSCWIAPRDIVPGTEWAAAINAAITASKVFLIIYTANSAGSSQVSREISLAETKPGVFVVPYKTDDTPLVGSFEYYLVGSHFISADYAKKDYKLEELYTHVTDIVGGAEPQPEWNPPVKEEMPVKVSEPIITTVENGDGSEQTPEHDRTKLPLIIGIAAAAVVVIVIVLIIVLGPRSEDEDGSEGNLTAENPTSVETEPTGTDIVTPTITPDEQTPTPVEITPTPDDPTPTDIPTEMPLEQKEIKDLNIQFLSHDCTGDYKGYVNGSGEPEGEGTFIGSFYVDYSEVRMTYVGLFENGIANGKGVSTETFVDGYVREYEGDFVNGVFEGEGTERSTSVAGDRIEYIGEFKDGKYNGKGIKTCNNKTDNIVKQVYDGTWEDGVFKGENNTYTLTYWDGKTEITEGKFDGNLISGTKTVYDADGNMILHENFKEKDAKEVLYEYLKEHGTYYPDEACYYIENTYYELTSKILDTEVTVYDTKVRLNVSSSEGSKYPLKFYIFNDQLNMKILIYYDNTEEEYYIEASERGYDGTYNVVIMGSLKDYLNGPVDVLFNIPSERYSRDEVAEYTGLMVDLLYWKLTEMLEVMDNDVTLGTLGLGYWEDFQD
ncbi:MAG: TIR domain-containing protein [Lachnospiraceae bacterium]|nr:TIR domain-containing protein [Lachnospiraceae bacterium]